MKSASNVAMGDRFVRADGSRTIYVVAALVDPPGLPPHVRLRPEDNIYATAFLMSVSALADSHFYRRAPAAR
jgi:hypothetical protein